MSNNYIFNKIISIPKGTFALISAMIVLSFITSCTQKERETLYTSFAGGNFTLSNKNVSIASSVDMGKTIVEQESRSTKVKPSIKSIKRIIGIHPEIDENLNASLVFRYNDNELNGLAEANLGLWKSENNGDSWEWQGGSIDTYNNTVSLHRINSFSLWTLAPPPLSGCTPPSAVNVAAATTTPLTAGQTNSYSMTGGTPNTGITWSVTPATGVSPASGTGVSTGNITFSNPGTYSIKFTATNTNTPVDCSPSTSSEGTFSQEIFAPAVVVDFDGDGKNNDVDLDDDNDGILDMEECPQAYPSRNSYSNWKLTGNAAPLNSTELKLTDNVGSQAGRAWFNQQIDVNQSFNVKFDAYLGNKDNGADGLAFCIQPSGTGASGSYGGGLGVWGIPNSMIVEFDTYYNGDIGDPAADHISIDKGSAGGFSIWNSKLVTLGNIEDNAYHAIEVDYNATSKLFRVYWDGVLKITANTNIKNDFLAGNNMAWWGFSGSTGGAYNQQKIVIKSYTNGSTTTCDIDGDGRDNRYDLDSDGDGIPDNIEAQTTAGYQAPSATTDAEGRVITYTTVGITPIDTDSDGTPDYIDTNSNNDAVSDTQQAGLTLSGLDNDGDGLDNAVDTNDGALGPVNAGITNVLNTYPKTLSGSEVDWRFLPSPGCIVAPTSAQNLVNGVEYYRYAGYDSTPENGVDGALIDRGYVHTLFDGEDAFLNDRSEYVSHVFKTKVFVTNAGNYNFEFTNLDDDGALFVNGVLVGSGNYAGGANVSAGTANLNAGYNDIEVRFSNGGGPTTCRLRWQGGDTNNSMVNIPEDKLFVSPVGPSAWFKADAIIAPDGSIPATWKDISRWGNNVTTDGGNNPTLYTTNSSQIMNFNPVVNFSDDIMRSADHINGFAYGKQGRTIFTVSKPELAHLYGEEYIMGYGRDNVNNSSQFIGSWQVGQLDWGGWGNHLSKPNFWVSGTPRMLSAVYQNYNLQNTNNATLFAEGSQVVVGNKDWYQQANDNADLVIGNLPDFPTYGGSNGPTSEVIVYPWSLTTAERERVESYLAIKYGFSLAHDYYSGAGVKLWDIGATGGYDNNVFGIGRDDCQGLGQKQSQSLNKGAAANFVTLGLGTVAATNASNTNTFTADKSFFLSGDNNGAMAATATALPSGVPASMNRWLPRKWRAAETGSGVGAVRVQIPTFGYSGMGNAKLWLVVADDANFTSGVTTVPMTIVGNTAYANYDFSGTKYFTFGGQVDDRDNDGIADAADDDEDNDGISDYLENSCATSPKNTWTSWSSYANKLAKGTLATNGTSVNVSLTSTANFGTTGSIFSYGTFNNYGDIIPNTTVPYANNSGTYTVTFSEQVQNPVLLFSSIGNGSSGPTFTFNAPYTVDYNGGGMTFNNSTTLSGKEGYCIVRFPGTYSSISFTSSAYEHYWNMSVGAKTALCWADTDGDGVPNHRDLDSDNDGIPDNIEAQSTAGYQVPASTYTALGYPSNYGTTGITPKDTDNDGVPDFRDTDTNDNQKSDTQEATLTLSNTDTDEDGLDNNIDTNDAAFGPVNAGITDVKATYPNNGTEVFWRLRSTPGSISNAAAGCNIVTNPNFNSGLTGWTAGSGWQNGGGYAVNYGEYLTNSTLSQNLTGLPTTAGSLPITFDLRANGVSNIVTSSSTASLELWLGGVKYAKFNNPSGGSVASVTTFGGATASTASIPITTSGAAVNNNMIITVPYPGGATALLEWKFTSQSDDWAIDNIVINSTTCPETFVNWYRADKGLAAEVLKNGSLTNNLDNWTATGNYYHNGNRVYFNWNTQTPNAVLSQTTSTKAGQTYTLSFNVETNGGANSGGGVVGVKVDILNGNVVLATTTVTKTAFGASTNHSLNFVAASAETTVRVTDVSTATYDIDISVDNFSMPGITNSPSDGSTSLSWFDQSPSANNSVATGAGANDPTYEENIINFNPAMYFDGGDYFDAPNSFSGDYTMFYIGKMEGTQNARITGSQVGNVLIGYWAGREDQLFLDGWLNNPTTTATTNSNMYTLKRATSGAFNFYKQGSQISSGAASVNSTIKPNLGGSTAENSKGYISEYIAYNRVLQQFEIEKIESYLALKYGLTIGHDYYAGNYDGTNGATTKIWDIGGSGGFDNGIAGIGREDCTGLDQRQSGAGDDVRGQSQLVIGLGGIAVTNQANPNALPTNNSYMLWGHDNQAALFNQSITAPVSAYANNRMQRCWKVSEKGTVGMTKVGLNYTYGNGGRMYLIASDNNTFDAADTWVELTKTTVGGRDYWAGDYNFTDGQYFTFATYVTAPGCVATSGLVNGVSYELYSSYDGTPSDGITGTLLHRGYLNTLTNPDDLFTNEISDYFSLVLKGKLRITTEGNYNFRFNVLDDAGAVFIDGVLKVSGVGGTPTGTAFFLTAGDHDIEVRWSENGGAETCQVQYTGPDNTNTWGFIPDSKLFINKSNPSAWFKADWGISAADGSSLASWMDMSSNDNDVSGSSAPLYYNANAAQLMNFNPVTTFNDQGLYSGDYINGFAYGKTGRTMFVVAAQNGPSATEYFTDYGQDVSNSGMFMGQNTSGALEFAAYGNHLTQTGYFTAANSGVPALFTGAYKNYNITNTNNAQIYANGNLVLQGAKDWTMANNDINELSVGGLTPDFPIAYGMHGRLAEVIYYPWDLTQTEREKVESYLAIKYGMSLSHNYLAGDGSTIYNISTFGNNVAGVGREDCSALYQKQAQSQAQNTNAGMVTMGLNNMVAATNVANTGTFGADRNYLVWGDDNQSTTTTVVTTIAGQPLINVRMNRCWKAQETGTGVGSVQVRVPLSTMEGAFYKNGQYFLMVSAAADLSSPTAIPLTVADGYATCNYDFPANSTSYFSFAAKAKPAPGCSPNNLTLWLKADDGVVSTAGSVDTWINAVSNATLPDVSQATAANKPTLNANGINFNPALSFDGQDWLTRAGVAKTDLVSATDYNYFVVSRRSTAAAANNVVVWHHGAGTTTKFGLDRGASGNLSHFSNGTASTAAVGDQNGTPYLSDVSFTGGQLTYASNGNSTNALTVANTNTTTDGYWIGREQLGTGFNWLGDVAEIITYKANLTATQKQQVRTYLALKYGLTLSHNYLAGNGTTVLFNADGGTAANFDANVAGIGREDCSSLNQKQSRSVNTANEGNMVTLALGAYSPDNASNTYQFDGDSEYLIFGNDAGSNLKPIGMTLTSAPKITGRIERIWKIQETGSVGPTVIRIPKSSVSTALSVSQPVYILVDSDSDFTNGGTTATAMTETADGLNYEICLDFDGTKYFTFAGKTNDYDGDGVADKNDLDDDNDGILDVNEGLTCPANLSSYNCSNTTNYRWVTWTSVTPPTTAIGYITLSNGDVVNVTYTGNVQSLQPSEMGSTAEFCPASSSIQMLQTYSGNNVAHTFQFSKEVINPIFQVWSLGQPGFNVTYTFTDSVKVLISNGALAKPAWNQVRAGEGDGSVLFSGIKSNIAFTANVSENWSGLQVAVGEAAILNNIGSDGCASRDTDNDGVPDYHDLDSDGDGIPDVIEAQTTAGYTVPGAITAVGATGIPTAYSTGLAPVDTDKDGTPDYLDANSNNHNTPDTKQAGITLASTDSDNDGIDDATDSDDNAYGPVNAGITATLAAYPKTLSANEVDWRYRPVPGGISTSLAWWFKGDEGLTTSGTSVTDWKDNWTNGLSVSQATAASQPTATKFQNFNPVLTFDGSNDALINATGYWKATTGNLAYNYFGVANNANVGGVNTHFFENTNLGGQIFFQPYNGNVTNGFWATYVSNIANQASWTGVPYLWSGRYKHDAVVVANRVNAVLQNGKQLVKNNTTIAFNGANGQLQLGANTGGWFYNGDIGEQIMYATDLTESQRQQVNSYLALKWGLTLSRDNDGDAILAEVIAGTLKEGDYIASDGTTKIWDASTNATYYNNVAGIGLDLASGLEQKQSRSVNATNAGDNMVTMGLEGIYPTNAQNIANFGADRNFLVWGNDPGSHTTTTAASSQITAAQAAAAFRLTRVWKAQETGAGVGQVEIRVPKSNLAALNSSADVYLVVADDAAFTTNVQVVKMANLDATTKSVFYDFAANSGKFFSFAGKDRPAPGCVTTNLVTWYKADEGTSTTTNGASVSSWGTAALAGNNATQATAGNQPIYNTNSINFNPSLGFDGNRLMTYAGTGLPTGATTRGSFVVATTNVVDASSYRYLQGYGAYTANNGFGMGRSGTNQYTIGYAGNDHNVGSSWSTGTPLLMYSAYNGTQAQGSVNGGTVTGTARSWNTLSNALAYIGAPSNNGIGTERWNGNIAEVINYTGTLTNTQIQQIETYLSIKYGISLTHNYIMSGITGNLFDANGGTAADYDANIAGIGRVDCSGLLQKQSRSVNTANAGNMVTIGLGNVFASNDANIFDFDTDNSVLMWGNDAGSNTKSVRFNVDVAQGLNARLERIWKAQETGTVGEALIQIPATSISTALKTGASNKVFVMVDSDTDFSTGAVTIEMTLNGTNYEALVDFAGTKYFTFGGRADDTDGDGVADSLDLDDDNDGILDCEENGLNNTDISNIFQINGSASQISQKEAQITPNSGNQSGNIWSKAKIDFNKDFNLDFEAFLGAAEAGGDGMAIVFHNDPNGLNTIGGAGGGLGASGIQNGLALRLDTYQNTDEPAGDFGDIRKTQNDAKLTSPVVLSQLENNGWHPINVTWRTGSKTLVFYVDGIIAGTLTGDLKNEYFGGAERVIFGYTASTGGAINSQRIRFTDFCQTPLELDTDDDGIVNQFDLDSDGDGIPDNIEAQTTAGYIAPGLISAVGATGIPTVYNQTTGLTVVDTDGDDTPDYLDTDSNGNGETDTKQAGLTTVLTGVDGDFDGLDDGIDNNDNSFGAVNAALRYKQVQHQRIQLHLRQPNGIGDLDQVQVVWRIILIYG